MLLFEISFDLTSCTVVILFEAGCTISIISDQQANFDRELFSEDGSA